MPPTLEIRDVRKAYGDSLAVDGVSLTVDSGTVCGLLGPNGAGKTTTIRMIMDIIAPDSGEIRIFGHRPGTGDAGRVGYLPEERGLYRKMTVTDHLVFFAELHGLTRAAALPEIESWLERVELADNAKSKVEELSKGMQQKIQLIGTVLHSPELVILDEPFSGLDPINQELFKGLLADYRAEGRTILFSTHIMEQAEKLCDMICLISGGRAILSGGLKEIKGRFGGRSYRLEGRGDLAALGEVPGVAQAVVRDGTASLLLEPGAEASEVLRRIVSRVEVREFRSHEPDLEEIFVKAVREAKEAR